LREETGRAAAGRGAPWRRLRRQAGGGPAASLRAALAEADGVLGGEARDRFAVYVPLFRGAKCVGFIGLGEKIYGVGYSLEELGYLSVLATQVGAALHNIALLEQNVERKLFEEELRIARKIQTQLLPGSPPVLDGFDLCATTVPSRYVGGDYYDFVVVEGKWLVLVVADVSGKGIPASILTATLQATVRSNADAQTDPERMMTRLNRLLYRNTSSAEFATLFYAVVDLETGRMRYANAGHDFPLVASNGGVSELGESGIVLGCLEEFDYTVSEFALPEASALVVYTDGVTDSQAGDGSSYGTVRLKRVLSEHAAGSARDICQSIVRDVRAFCTPEAQDDLTLMVLKRGA
ncbi:MAG: serine/threonine-protein phosphatase, partial [Candidatus Krumholzibacteria bacterium]|nr:serine/threonine-protein phosphatase [Candidatus Krumholzibacteria bacterium]